MASLDPIHYTVNYTPGLKPPKKNKTKGFRVIDEYASIVAPDVRLMETPMPGDWLNVNGRTYRLVRVVYVDGGAVALHVSTMLDRTP